MKIPSTKPLLPMATPSLNHRTRHRSKSARDSFPPLFNTASTRSFEKPFFVFDAFAGEGSADFSRPVASNPSRSTPAPAPNPSNFSTPTSKPSPNNQHR